MENNLYSLEQKRYERKREKKKSSFPFAFIILLSLLIIVIIFYFNNNQTELVLARFGEVTDGFQTEGLIVRDERVYNSPVTGPVSLKKEEGERVSYGQEVLQVDQSLLYNPRAGIISYATDGLERRLRPDMLEQLNLKDMQRLKRDYQQLVEGKHLKSDQPAFRIVDNGSLYLVIRTTVREVKRYQANEMIFIRPVDMKLGLIEGQIIRLSTGEKEGLMVVKLKRFIREWLNSRWIEVEFIKNIYQGVIIPREAIFTCPEGEGVLVSQAGGDYKFRELKVLEGNEEKVVVEGLKIGDYIVENPSEVGYSKGVE